MLGKLLKYDFKSMWKQFAIVWPAALVLALVARLCRGQFAGVKVAFGHAQPGFYYQGPVLQALSGVCELVFVCVLIAMFVVAMVFAVQRFYKGLLGDEGYLMHTLPVRPWQLILSKLLCAEAATVISVLVALASIGIFVWGYGERLIVSGTISGTILEALLRAVTPLSWGEIWLLLAEVLVQALAAGLKTYLQIYAAITIGHLFQKHRVAMTFAAYVVISALISLLRRVPDIWVLTSVGVIGGQDGPTVVTTSGNIHATIWVGTGLYLVLAAVFFFVTDYILKRRLNLE